MWYILSFLVLLLGSGCDAGASTSTNIIDCLKMYGLSGEYTVIDQEECNRTIQACVQLTVFPTKSKPELRHFGCVHYEDILYEPKLENDIWVPRSALRINGTVYVGQLLMCKQRDMCNEEFAVTLEGIYESIPVGYDQNETLLQVLVIITLVLLVGSPIYFVFFYISTLKRRRIAEEKEGGRRIEPLADYDKRLYRESNIADRIVEDGKIPTLKELQIIYDDMREKRTKERVHDAPIDLTKRMEPMRIFTSEKVYRASDDLIIRTSRTVSTRFDNLLFAMLCFGPTTLRIKPHNLASLFADFYEIIFHEAALIELPANDEYLIIGDLRGEYRDLHRWLRICGTPPTKKLIILGGMLSDENLFSLETFVFLAALKVSMPYDVYILRGAPESLNFEMGRVESFSVSNAITTVVSNICERLPVAAVIGRQIFCVHSGISPLLKSLSDINRIDRSRERLEPETLLCHLIFSEPSDSVQNYKPMPGGRGLIFGAGAIKKFCSDHSLSVIIRAHNPTPPGFFFAAKGRLLSLWSTPGYDGCENSAVALIHADHSIEIMQMTC